MLPLMITNRWVLCFKYAFYILLKAFLFRDMHDLGRIYWSQSTSL